MLLHKFIEHEGTFVLKHGEPASCSDVLSLIRGGDKVWVMLSAGRHNYKNTDHVRINVKRGRQAYLYSCTRSGTSTTALTDLPRYERPDDRPLGRPASVAPCIEHVPPKDGVAGSIRAGDAEILASLVIVSAVADGDRSAQARETAQWRREQPRKLGNPSTSRATELRK